MKIFILSLMVGVSLFSVAASADEDSVYVVLARDRSYVGGQDESDLKVQTHLVANEKNKNLNEPESDEGF